MCAAPPVAFSTSPRRSSLSPFVSPSSSFFLEISRLIQDLYLRPAPARARARKNVVALGEATSAMAFALAHTPHHLSTATIHPSSPMGVRVRPPPRPRLSVRSEL